MASPLGARFWQLWSASTFASLADGLYRVALPLIAVHYTRSPILVALVTVAAFLPWLLLTLHAGALADRMDRRRIMVTANTVRAAVLAVFAVTVVSGVDNFWTFCVTVFVVGVAEVFFDGTAQSTLPMLVERDQLGRANSRLYAANQIMESFLGQAGGGLLVAVAVAAAVVAPAALYGLAAVAVLLIAGQFRPERTGAPTTVRQDISEGVRYLAGHRLLRTLAIMSGLTNLTDMAFNAVFVLFVVGEGSPMGFSEAGFGLLLTATAVGASLGALLTERVQRLLGRSTLIMLAVLTQVVLQAVPAMTANVVAVVAAFILHGAGITMWSIVVVSFRQRVIPAELLGRVNSCYRLLSWGAIPIGAVLGGILGELIGLRGLFVTLAVISLSMLLGMRVLTNRAMADAERDAERDALGSVG